MKVMISGVLVPCLDEVHRLGIRHPILGEFLDIGTYALIDGMAAGAAGFTALLPETTLALDPSADSIHRVEQLTLAEAGEQVAHWHRWLAEGGVLSLVIQGERAEGRPLLILCGHPIPCMGAVPPCCIEDIRTTWERLAYGRSGSGRFLLEEIESPVDPAAEEALTERLRQLYGE